MDHLSARTKKQNAFTLIELILSVVIIIILTGAVLRVIDPRALRGRARDGNREADVRIIQTALEMYFSDYRGYPSTNNDWVSVDAVSDLHPYLNEIPEDPSEGGSYNYSSNGSTYFLVAIMEMEESGNGNCFGFISPNPSLCYGVSSPLGN